MENITDITNDFGQLYLPIKALIFYEATQTYSAGCYVEAFDIGEDGFPKNAKPLNIEESRALAKRLNASGTLRQAFLKPQGLLPEHLLYINPDEDGFALWRTPARKVRLYFKEGLGIPNGKANVPPLVWKASRNELHIYALDATTINESTPLCHAPFFNVYDNGKVCMGNVEVDIAADCGLEDFMMSWEQYFFNSYFTHLLFRHSIQGNIVQLWSGLIGSNKKFPLSALRKNNLTIKDIIR